MSMKVWSANISGKINVDVDRISEIFALTIESELKRQGKSVRIWTLFGCFLDAICLISLWSIEYVKR